MHRRLLPLLFVLTALALSAWPGPAGAIVCPVTARAVGPQCCGPPAAARDVTPQCCTTFCCEGPGPCCAAGDAQPACPLSELTIASSPNPSTDGQPVTISGRLFSGAAGTTVSLWQKLPGQASFTRVAQTTTGPSGDYTIKRGAGTVQMNTTWYTSTSSATSAMLVQRVSAQVRLLTSTVAGTLVKLNGRVSPAHRGERIALERRAAKGWQTIARAVIGPLSRFTVRHRFATKGNVTLRAVFGGDARNVRSTSPPIRVLVG